MISRKGCVLSEYVINPDQIEIYIDQFNKNGYVRLEKIFKKKFFETLSQKIDSLEQHAFRRDFIMPEYNSPRKMNVLGGRSVEKLDGFFLDLYLNKEIRTLIKTIVQHNIYSSIHPEERIVINYLNDTNDTHGWHLDDPEYSFVVFIHSPEHPSEGGLLEYIKNYENQNNESAKIMKVCKEFHTPNTAYILRASKHLHRVSPIKAKNKRVVINMSFDASEKTLNEYGNTASLLYATEVL